MGEQWPADPHPTLPQGNGILPGKDQLRYQGVAIGVVQELELAQDGRKIAVLAKVDSRARPLIRKGSDFWLVSPKASLTEISGLDTLVSATTSTCSPGGRTTRWKMNSTPGRSPRLSGPGAHPDLTPTRWGRSASRTKILLPGPGGGQRHQHPPRERTST